ncbi:MAG: carboxypeptidase-like regulatory domain-containing protein [Bacteroidota bacterium]
MKSFALNLLCFALSFSSLTAQTLVGSVKDKNEKGVPYVNIGIPAKAFGIISDEEGGFQFKQTSEKDTDTIQVSCIGYQTIYLSFANFKLHCQTKVPIHLTEAVYTLATTTVRPNEFEKKVLGAKNIADLECITLDKFTSSDTAAERIAKEKGLGAKSIGIELGNKISINKGHQTFIDKIEFKTCVGPKDTAIYRVNIYVEGKTLKRIMTPIGMVKMTENQNILKEGIIVKAIGKTEVQSIDVSKQNIEVFDDFIVALECIYASDTTMKIGAETSLFGSTDILFRASVMSQWVKIPLINVTFISASVTYNKKKAKRK